MRWVAREPCFTQIRCRLGIRPLAGAALLFLFLLPWSSAHTEVTATVTSGDLSEIVTLLQRGNFEDAGARALTAAKQYADHGDSNSQCRALLLLAEAQQSLGDYHDAAHTLATAESLAQSTHEVTLRASALQSMGNVSMVLGQPESAVQFFNDSLAAIGNSQQQTLRAGILNDRGNYYSMQGDVARALADYSQSAELARVGGNAEQSARAWINAARAAQTAQHKEDTTGFLTRASELFNSIPSSHGKAYLLIGAAEVTAKQKIKADVEHDNAQRWLTEALQIAQSIDDPIGQSYALGYLGQLAEQQESVDEALARTNDALFKSGQSDDQQTRYMWNWQKGRLLARLGKHDQAIAAYQQAVDALQLLRFRIPFGYGMPDVSFRESIGPVYFQLVDLLLRKAADTHEPAQLETILKSARGTVERFKAAELRDYFHDQCVDALQAKLRDVEKVSTNAAIIYPVMLDDRLELLLSLPGAPMKRFRVDEGRKVIADEIHRFRTLLEKLGTFEYRAPAAKLYQWLIAPLAADLKAANVDTLVFVPEGPLLTVPVAALYDEKDKRYLIQDYAIAMTPGVELTDPRALPAKGNQALSAGLSVAVEGFPALAHVKDELADVKQTFGGEPLLNEQFERSRMRDQLQDKSLSILHIATHGQFSANPRNSFLLAYDGRLSFDELADDVGLFKFRDQPLELLVLSACETAQGDDRAALGLSGVAIKAGARSALGTLWQVKDQATEPMMRAFYQNLSSGKMTRAQALAQAQREVSGQLIFHHAGYWSAFIMLNNWL